jgi:hypothetical protein
MTRVIYTPIWVTDRFLSEVPQSFLQRQVGQRPRQLGRTGATGEMTQFIVSTIVPVPVNWKPGRFGLASTLFEILSFRPVGFYIRIMISRQIHFCHGLPRPRLPHGKVQKRKPSHRRSGCALTQFDAVVQKKNIKRAQVVY